MPSATVLPSNAHSGIGIRIFFFFVYVRIRLVDSKSKRVLNAAGCCCNTFLRSKSITHSVNPRYWSPHPHRVKMHAFFVIVAVVCFLGQVKSWTKTSPVRSSFSRNSLRMSSIAEEVFVKYQGLGNDFILVDNTKSSTPKFSPEDAIRMCNRNFGIGGDGLIFALPGVNGCDYTMRIYNSDGTEPQMCGNGIRCMARFIKDEVEKKASGTTAKYTIWTNAGEIIPKISEDGSITVDMGKPILQAELVPTTLAATKDGMAVDAVIEAAGTQYKTTCVSMGNPHSVRISSFSSHDWFNRLTSIMRGLATEFDIYFAY